MNLKTPTYISLIIFHALVAIAIYIVPIISTLYTLAILFFGIVYIVKNKNKNNEVLYVSAYIIGIEVFLRMTEAGISHEIGKYAVILYMLMGMYYSGIQKKSLIYALFIVILMPSILVSVQTLSYDSNFRKAIIFNLLGSVCLGISAIYCYQRDVTLQHLKKFLNALSLAVICIITYLFLYTPSNLEEIITSTSSNFDTSGGFGPNQVSTILGLGMFVYFAQILLNSPTRILLIVNTLLFVLCSYRGILTFSRGGVYVGLIMIVLLTIFVFKNVGIRAKSKIILMLLLGIGLGILVWIYTSVQTGGMIEKRYANQNASGVEKESKLSGRETLMETEIQMFLNNPILGVGAGKNREERKEMTGIAAASHNEVTRLLAEHGTLGIFALLILIFVPLYLFPKNRQNIFLLSFFFFWALTINHAAMRLAAPAFIYALSLLKVRFDENPPLHREQTL